MQALIVIPTYNESENICNLNSNFSVLVVDDNSPDNTFGILNSFIEDNTQKFENRLSVVKRNEKNGRGGAVWHGFLIGLKDNFDVFIEMDADFSHDPKYLQDGIELIKHGADVVIGARYPNGKIIDWPFKRRLFSWLANFLCRSLISFKIYDYTNGYRFYNRGFVANYASRDFLFYGYINLSETISLAIKNKLAIKSFPITFINRKIGASNTNFSELVSSFFAIFILSWKFWFDKKFK
jgi:dolichol-phosphate mannosyltransferase